MANKKTNKELKSKVRKKNQNLRQSNPELKRQLRLMKSVLDISKRKKVDMDSKVAQLLKQKGYLSKSGRITEKGKEASKIL